ncbi:hypothetical protein B0A58_08855 [Flavobacterium branchiophilum NBRC 15030 = ATCC 35035]|uniref:Uncharacterized protein n=1 Tax=Flavobacterium branchiophilum TaxID=55197 RepID=A0A543G4B4_9FLAO|nr:hypothetical protein [Flavobacterium branchiophilum]OXA75343.1 hypothetical protein B0A58_08855 [Flavobacterium branchiophilum NBRC 15030 = ATCC 35035]TQM40942.1 hypothetical protein BC670_1865 [Flavobacterium branchiophilum]GEM54753.1 hypothetical protein FB1_09740 [Flavobacterium branchiophilum NBRC 15030 = ATCC 35035]
MQKYNQNQNIEFTISNNSERKYYYVSIEYFENNNWFELINDISQPKSRASVINLIKPNQTINKKVSIQKVFYLKNFLNFKKYRLKVLYGKSADEINSTYFSNSFEIIKND